MSELKPGDVALEAREISKWFGPFQALSPVSFCLRAGRVFGLLGPNGSGKTTLLRIVLGMQRPDTGTVRFGFASRQSLSDQISYIPEERGLYQKAAVRDLLVYFGRLKGARAQQAEEKAQQWLVKFQLEDWANKKVETLSKGMQQLIQFAMALVNDPDIIILDEPFSGLDPLGTRKVEEAISDLRDQGKTFLISTHQLTRAESLCDDILLLDRGRPLACGSLQELLLQYSDSVIVVSGEFTLNGFSGIRDVVRQGDRTRIYLHPHVSVLDFLNYVNESALELGKFSVFHSTLEDVFFQILTANRATLVDFGSEAEHEELTANRTSSNSFPHDAPARGRPTDDVSDGTGR